MTEIRITVRGEFVAFRQPERATVRLAVSLEGPAAAPVFSAVAASLAQVVEGIKAMHRPESGPVTWFSSDRVRTSSRRPWNKDGKQLPVVHTATASVQAKFSDFEALSSWLGSVVEVRGVVISGVDWALTEANKRELTGQVRAEAVRNARDKAQEYAAALDLGQVHVVEIADSGMLGEGLHPTSGNTAVAYARGSADGGSELKLIPEDVSVEASVDARFRIA